MTEPARRLQNRPSPSVRVITGVPHPAAESTPSLQEATVPVRFLPSWSLGAVLAGALAAVGCQTPTDPSPARGEPGKTQYAMATDLKAGELEVAHEFRDQYPTGVAVARDGRIFACYPRWGDPVKFSVGLVQGTGEVPYPNAELNSDNGNPDHFYGVQSVVVDPADRLWVVDSGSHDFQPIRGQQWPKLVGIDLSTNQVFKSIHFPPEVVLPTSYLNDVRFDLARGPGGTAYLSDSSTKGTNAIIVVNLATGKSIRRLANSAAVHGEASFTAVMEGKPLLQDKPGEPPKQAIIGSDGIAVSGDGSRVFFCPLSSRALHSVDAAVLADPSKTDADVEKTLTTEQRKFASDGLEADSQNRLYLTDWEHNAIVVRQRDRQYQTLVADPRLWWPDSMSLAADGHLYVTATQLHRQPSYHDGVDKREKPYLLLRVKTAARPVTQKAPTITASDMGECCGGGNAQ
jgi:sugar lactone lactonase YvrE